MRRDAVLSAMLVVVGACGPGMIHGTNDNIVPLQTAKDAESTLRAAGKTVEAQYYDGGSHNIAYDAPYHDQVIQRVSAFLTKYLGG